MDDYLTARTITTPFGLLDCDVPCDASIAVIVSAADTAPDLASKPIRVEAVGTQIMEPLPWDQSTSTHEPQVLGPASHLWTRTDLTPADVDIAQLYDGFSFNCLSIGSRHSASAALVRRRTSSTAATTSPATGFCPSTRTADSSPTAAPTAWAFCVRRSSNSAVTRASGRSPAPRWAWSPAAAHPQRRDVLRTD